MFPQIYELTTEFIGIMPIIESVIQDENYNLNFKKLILHSKTLQELRDYEQSYKTIMKERLLVA